MGIESGQLEQRNTTKNTPQKIDANLLKKINQVHKLQKTVLGKLEYASNTISSPIGQKYIEKVVKSFGKIQNPKELIAIATMADAMIKYNADKQYLIKNPNLEKNIVLAAQILKLPSEAVLSLTACSAPMQTSNQKLAESFDAPSVVHLRSTAIAPDGTFVPLKITIQSSNYPEYQQTLILNESQQESMVKIPEKITGEITIKIQVPGAPAYLIDPMRVREIETGINPNHVIEIPTITSKQVAPGKIDILCVSSLPDN